MSIVTLVVQDNMLAAATGMPGISDFYQTEETVSMQKERRQARDSGYPAWYLFGCPDKSTEGLVSTYNRHGYAVTICPESRFTSVAGGTVSLLDLQLAGATGAIMTSLADKIQISGYLADRFASKAEQAEELASSGNKRFLPAQVRLDRNSIPRLPDTATGIFIVKDALGSGRRGASGTPYTVWRKNLLAEALPEMLAMLPPGRELVLSEFIHTSDPYAGNADHVVHKMHFTSARNADGVFELKPYGDRCQLLIHRCRRERLEQSGVLFLAEYIGPPEYWAGSVSTIREFDDFSRALSFFAQSRLILAIDFMVPPDGQPRFLEANKLGATFAETFDPFLPPVIDAYPGMPL